MCHCDGARRMRRSSVRQVLRDPDDVVTEGTLADRRHRRTNDGVMAVGAAVKYTPTGTSGAPARMAIIAGPAGNSVRSPKNSTSTPPAPMLRSQSRHDLVVGERLEHRSTGTGSERDDGHAEVAAQPDEPVEQLGRMELLHDDRHGGGPGRLGQRPAHSQPPRWGKARMRPRPAASPRWM